MTLSNWQLFLRIAVTITLYTNCNLIFNPCNFISPNCDFISQNYYTFYYFSEMWSYFTCKFFFLFWSHNYMFIFVLIKSLKSRKVHKLILDSISTSCAQVAAYKFVSLDSLRFYVFARGGFFTPGRAGSVIWAPVTLGGSRPEKEQRPSCKLLMPASACCLFSAFHTGILIYFFIFSLFLFSFFYQGIPC